MNMMQVPFVDLAAQHNAIAADVEAAMGEVVRKTNFILGEEVARFEEAFASFCQTEYAVGVDSGTTALEFALRAFDIGPGDEVITAANTFIATALAVSEVGATPVLVDVDPCTYNMDPVALERAITPRTKAVIPVHLYGQMADMEPLMAIARRHGLRVIEDACQAHGALYRKQRAGSLADAAAFSFYPAKNLGAYGDGGMLVTNDPEVAEAARMLRNYGQGEKYHHLLRGYNRRLDTLQAAVLGVKLPHLDSWNAARRRHAMLYGELLDGSQVVLPTEAVYGVPVYHLYVIRVEDRDGLQAHLRDRGIATGIHYPIPIHLQPAYRELGYSKGDFPVAEQAAAEILSLPMYPELAPEAIEYVADTIKGHVSNAMSR